VRWDL